MARQPNNPATAMIRAGFGMARMAADAQFVIAARMFGFAAGTATSGETIRMIAEKQAAMAEGLIRAGMSVATGKSPAAVARAALAPAKRTLAANKKRLGGGGRNGKAG